jgi:hypothetical protein
MAKINRTCKRKDKQCKLFWHLKKTKKEKTDHRHDDVYTGMSGIVRANLIRRLILNKFLSRIESRQLDMFDQFPVNLVFG